MHIQRDTQPFRRTSLALFAGGFSTFAILYCLQPLLPQFSESFQVSPAGASLALSVTTMAMAGAMLFVGALSDGIGRKPVMALALFSASAIAVFVALSSGFEMLLILRVFQGIVLAGLPAIAMTYLGEEMEPASLGYAMGLYISGNSVGGMGGRIITGILTHFFNWRIAVAAVGVLSIGAAFLFWVLLPESRNFQRQPLRFSRVAMPLVSQFKDLRLVCLYGLGFLIMGGFVTLYNYIGYQLLAPPYHLNQALVSWIFIVYIMGTISSTWMGRLSDRNGRDKVMAMALGIIFIGALLTLSSNLWFKIAGIAIVTFGFFGGHSIASSWVGSIATVHKAQASSLYLFFYYAGSSVSGTVGGLFYTRFGWKGVVGMIVGYIIAGLALNAGLKRLDSGRKHGDG